MPIKMSEIRAQYPMYADMSDEDLVRGLWKSHYSDLPLQKMTSQIEFDTQRGDPTAGMSGVEKFRAGMGKAFTDVARGVGQMIPGAVSRADVAESRNNDAKLMDTGAGMAGNLAGSVAAFAPTAMIPGANTVTGAGLIGAASGLMAPSASTGETFKNTLAGGAFGAAVPAAIVGGKTVKSLIDPLYQGGRDKIIGRAITDAAAQDPLALAQALRGNKSAVPGVQRTVAEVAENPSLAALQRTTTQTNPAVMNDVAAMQLSNNQARIDALQQIIGDPKVMKSARDSAANALYAAANGKPVTITPELQSLLSRPQMKTAAAEAATLAENEGRTFSLKPPTAPKASSILDANGQPMSVTPGAPGSMVTQDAHTIKRALDDTIEGLAGQGGLGKNAKRAAANTKEEFLTEVEKQVPEYGAARTAYAAASKPINQSELAAALLDRSTKDVQGQITPAAFKRALNDRTAQSALGRKDATLANTFDASQMGTTNAIMDDLARLDFANKAGKGSGSDTVQKLAYSNMLGQAGAPNMVRNFGPAGVVGNLAERAGNIAYKGANEKLSEQLARALLDPDSAAQLVTGAMVTPQMQALADALRRGGTALGASAPALVQANQQ